MTINETFQLKKFSSASKKRINELILNEKCRKELEKGVKNELNLLQKLLESTGKRKSRDTRQNSDESCELEFKKKQPDKLLEAGKTLPKKYARQFSSDLKGIPLEEIDDYYKSDHVNKNCLKSQYNFVIFLFIF